MKIFTAPFVQNQRTSTAVVTAAVTGLGTDAPGNTILLATAGPDGAILTDLQAMPRATTTATSLLLFLSKDGGTTKRLIDSELMAAYTLSTTTVIPETSFARYNETSPLRLEANDQLYVGIQVANASGIVFKSESGDF